MEDENRKERHALPAIITKFDWGNAAWFLKLERHEDKKINKKKKPKPEVSNE